MKIRATSTYHRCPKCESVFRGPGFFRHIGFCQGQTDIEEKLRHSVVHHYTISNGTLYRSDGKAVKQL